jgi:hypothetical protein
MISALVDGLPEHPSDIFSGQHRRAALYAQNGRNLLEAGEEVFVVAARAWAGSASGL